MQVKRGFIWLLVFSLLSIPLAAQPIVTDPFNTDVEGPIIADSFSIDVNEMDNRITIDQFAHFEIKIKNDLGDPDEYHITNLNFPTWDVRTDPIVNPITLEIPAKEERSVNITVDPLKIRDIGTYAVQISIASKRRGEMISVPLKVIVTSTDTLIQGYMPTVLTSVSIPEEIDPREDIPVRIVLNNQNIINYDELVVLIESNLLNERHTLALGPKEEQSIELSASLDPLTTPQKDNLVISIFYHDRSIINPITKQYQVTEYLEHHALEPEKRFLTTILRYGLKSNNPSYAGTFKAETKLLHSIFSSEKPNAKVIAENGKRFFLWQIEMKGNEMQVMVKRNYVPLLVVILLIVALTLIYFVLRSPLVIIKESGNMIKKEGGISEMSVVIHVKNRGQKKLTEIEITDMAPSLVSVEREISIGSLQPNKILRHDKKGHTIIKWNVHNLEPSEERVLAYRIKTKLSILGGFNLAAATAVFKQDKRTLTGSSNLLQVRE